MHVRFVTIHGNFPENLAQNLACNLAKNLASNGTATVRTGRSEK